MDIDIRSLLQVQGETLAIEIQEKEGLTLAPSWGDPPLLPVGMCSLP